MRRLPRYPALVLAMALATACGGGTDVKSGTVSFTLNGPVAARAIIFRIEGAHSAIEVPSGQPFRIFTSGAIGDTVTVAVVANAGSVLTGEVIDIQVPDVSVKPVVTMLQVAGTDYALKIASSFSLSVVVP